MVFLPLIHTLSKSKTSDTHQFLKTSSLHSSTRFLRRRQNHREISLPLSSCSDYILSLSIGQHPSRTTDLYMDIGSDLIWPPFAPFECILCEGKLDILLKFHPPNVNSAVFVPCNSPACSAAYSALPSFDLCTLSGCPLETIEIGDCAAFRCPNFYYAYGDGNLVVGIYSNRLSIQSAKPTTRYGPTLKGNGEDSFEELQELFEEMFHRDMNGFGSSSQTSNVRYQAPKSSAPACNMSSSSNNKRNCSGMSSAKANGDGFSSSDFSCLDGGRSFCLGAEDGEDSSRGRSKGSRSKQKASSRHGVSSRYVRDSFL